MSQNYTFVRLSLIFEIYFRPIKAVIEPQTQAPTTTHTSNTVTNFDVAVLILMNPFFNKFLHLFRNLFESIDFFFKLKFLNLKIVEENIFPFFLMKSYRIGVFASASTKINRTVILTEFICGKFNMQK